MKLIVGLGNPGEKYANTRHNFGFMAVDAFAKKHSGDLWRLEKKFNALVLKMKLRGLTPAGSSPPSSAELKSAEAEEVWRIHPRTYVRGLLRRWIGDLVLVKPQTFMNASGYSVAPIANFYKIEPEDVWVIHDDVDLPLGKMKIRKGGAAGGHRGVASIIKQLGRDDFVRFRLGIGRPVESRKEEGMGASGVENFVLQNFNRGEKAAVKRILKKVTLALGIAIEKNIATAMNRFNAG